MRAHYAAGLLGLVALACHGGTSPATADLAAPDLALPTLGMADLPAPSVDLPTADAATGDLVTVDALAPPDLKPVYGYCTRPCGTVADCCPKGAIDCPSNMYPNNYQCSLGACLSPTCGSDNDCHLQDPTTACRVVEGFAECALPCSTDGDCTLPLNCSGVDDNGQKYCRNPNPTGCGSDADCYGFGKCVDKLCVCATSADCTHAVFSACTLN